MHPIRRPAPALLVALVLALLLAACGSDGTEPASNASAGPGVDAQASDRSEDATPDEPPPGSGSPAFTAAVLGGGELSSSSFEGEPTVLWFWAPWCTSCRAEADDVMAAAEALDGSVEVIGVAGRGEVDEMEGFVSDTGTGGLTHVVDRDGSIWTSFEVIAQPAFAFIDGSGSVEVVVGALGEDALVERMTALAEA
jgi:thiol-disulfide isomerase/thioredoxin